MTPRGVLFSLALGILGSVLASYIYAAGIWWTVGVGLLLPISYLLGSLLIILWRLGLVWIWPRWKSPEVRSIGKCRTAFRFWTVTGRTSLNRAEVEAAILARGATTGCEFRILLLHPKSPHLADFCRAEGADPGRTAKKIRDTTDALHAIRDKHGLSLAVRWDQDYPTWRLAAIDDIEMHLGTFAPGRKGYQGFRIVLRDRGRDSLVRQFVRTFDQVWEKSEVAS